MGGETGEGLLGRGGLLYLLGYLAVMLGLGWAGYRARREHSLADFYLGGRGMGLAVLFLTLYATQYSGNTLLGFVGQAYRNGFTFLVSVTFMMAVVGAYLIYAPRLHQLSHQRGYITMGDYLQDRFGDRRLTVLASMLGVAALANYVLTNLKVLGELTEMISGGWISYTWGVILLAAVMLVYEAAGGMRAVAWTDVVQGLVLLVGVVVIFAALQMQSGGMGTAGALIAEQRPDFYPAPSASQKATWMSTLLLVFAGISMYPHAVQRIYAARDARVLRRSLQLMVFMPLFTTLLMVTLGILGTARLPALDGSESDRVTLLLLEDLVRNSPGMRWMVLLFVGAIVAGTMSTVDSSMLAISSQLTRDVYQPWSKATDERRLSALAKISSAVLTVIVVLLTLVLRDRNIWALIEIKLELLCQVAPAVFLGLHWRNMRSGPVLAGMIAGTVLALSLIMADWWGWGADKPLGIHAGVWGLVVNTTIAVGGSLWLKPAGATAMRERA